VAVPLAGLRTWATPELGLVVAAVLMPPAAALAPQAIAPLLAIAAVLSLALGAHRRLVRLAPAWPLILMLGLLCVWATASALWSISPLHSLLEGLRLFAIVGGGLIVVASALDVDARGRERIARSLVWGFVLGIVILAVAALARATLPLPAQGTPVAHWLRRYTRFDRGATILALALWPMLLAVDRPGAWWRRVALVVVTALVVFALPSRAAMLSILVGLAVWPLAWRQPKLVAGVMSAGIVAVGLAFSLLTLDSATIARIHERLPWLQDSALHRLAIWHFGMDRIAERPLLGWGLDASRDLPGGSAVMDDPALPDRLIGFGQWMPLHPHNAVLQWRLELGIPGAILCTLALLWILARSAASTPPPRPGRALQLSLIAASLVIFLVSFGFWQAWWQSSIWLLAALALGAAPTGELERAPARTMHPR